MAEHDSQTKPSRWTIRWLAVLLLAPVGTLAARPLLVLQFFHSDDGLDHLLRLFALDRTLRQGVVYPRWLFALAYGYGYPIFNYYPPLAAYVAEMLRLLGLGLVEAIRGTGVICVFAAILGAYALGAEFFHDTKHASTAGILTAVAYVFFPYFLIDIYVRGAIAEVLAAAILPWLVWAARRGERLRALDQNGHDLPNRQIEIAQFNAPG